MLEIGILLLLLPAITCNLLLRSVSPCLPDRQHSQPFQTFCEDLLARVPDLRLWGASCQHRHTPRSWQTVTFTRPLRCPPVVVREVAQAPQMTRFDTVACYSVRGVPDHTDGPPIKWVFHRGTEHPGWQPINCVRCGEEVARFLRSLCVGARGEWCAGWCRGIE